MENTTENTPRKRSGIFKVMKRVLPLLVVLVAIALITVPLGRKISAKKADLAYKQAHASKTEKPKTNVITMEMVPGLVTEKISLPGVVKPWISLEVVAEVRGKIVQKVSYEGKKVSKGDILAVIDKSDYQNNYDSAKASYETALTTEKRLKALSKKKFVTQSQLDDAIARVKNTKAQMDNAKLNLSRCTIRSPMEGVVDMVYIENGKFLSSGDPVVKILKMDKVKIKVGIPESDVDAVRKLKTFDMTIDALDGKTITGEYHYLYKTTDSLARLYNLEIKVDNLDGQILPDMFTRVKIVKKKVEQGIAVPMYSLVTQDKTVGVYVEKHGVAQFKPVQTGIMDGWKTEVSDGLDPGEFVVVVGHRIIEDGENINVTRTIRDMEELTQ